MCAPAKCVAVDVSGQIKVREAKLMYSVPCRHVACGIRCGTIDVGERREPSARQVDLLGYSATQLALA